MLIKQHVFQFLSALILIQYCVEVTGYEESTARRAPLSTMKKSGSKNRRGGGNRARPCKQRITPFKKGTANKTSDDSEQGRFYPGPFGWDITKFPRRLRPQEPPCYEDPQVGNRAPVAPPPPQILDVGALRYFEEATCKALLEAVKQEDKAKADRPKPGERQYPDWGWDIGTVIRAKDSSPLGRMREHNLKYQIQRCKKKQNKNKKSKTERYWTAPDYAQIAAAISQSKGNDSPNNGRMSSGESEDGRSREPTASDDAVDPPNDQPGPKDTYIYRPTLPAESYADGGTAHAGKSGHKTFVDRIFPGLGKPPLRFLPWSEIFGYRPAKQRNTQPSVSTFWNQPLKGPGWMDENY